MAANENFGFTIISNTDTSYNVCTWGSNEKLYAKNKATKLFKSPRESPKTAIDQEFHQKVYRNLFFP